MKTAAELLAKEAAENWDEEMRDKRERRAPYLVKLAARRKAMKNYWRYIEECKRRYPGGSESQGS